MEAMVSTRPLLAAAGKALVGCAAIAAFCTVVVFWPRAGFGLVGLIAFVVLTGVFYEERPRP